MGWWEHDNLESLESEDNNSISILFNINRNKQKPLYVWYFVSLTISKQK